MTILEDYLSYYNEYQKKYGVKFALFYQIGKFHELYGVDNTTEKLGNVTEIATLLNIKETRTDTSILENSRTNPQMAGFNSVSLDRNVDLLVDQGYTIVIVNQKLNTSPIEREVAFIASPSTNIHGANDPYIVSIYMDQEWNKKMQTYYRYIGMAAMDITTGKSYTCESNSSPGDVSRAEDDLNRFLQTYSPVEIVLNYPATLELDLDRMISNWGFKKANEQSNELKPVVYLNIDHISPLVLETCLGGFYPRRGHLNPVEYVGLTLMPKALHAFVYLLRFCNSHNRELLNILPIPCIHEDENSLILDTSSLLQLDIIEGFYLQQKRDTVYTLFNSYLLTPMGRRLMRERLTNPITDIDILQRRYADIDIMGLPTDIFPEQPIASLKKVEQERLKIYEYVEGQLQGVRDLDRLHRKIALGTLAPSEFYFLSQSHRVLDRIIKQLTPHYPFLGKTAEALALLQQGYTARLNLEEAGKCTCLETLSSNLFQPGVYPDIDHIITSIQTDAAGLVSLCQTFSNYIQPGSEGCKYREDLVGDGGCHFTMTKPGFQKFKKNFTPAKLNDAVLTWEQLVIDDRNKSNVKITLPAMSAIYDKKAARLVKLRALTTDLFQTFLKSFLPLATEMENISHTFAVLDLNHALYRLKIQKGYVLPILKTGSSHIIAKALRHPVVEKKNNYVAQDLELGGNTAPDGILLYGVNQTGKSCTMKSLGIAVVLAQAGFVVPAARFEFTPYRNIMTRILSNDNMANGLSTFAVEMVELRSILTRCHARSLILGDEVCHGTESASAVSLVAAAVMHMSRQKSTFIFATHLHELSKISEITELPNVQQFHLSVSFQGDTIIYDRFMKQGSGLGRYGIEVAKFLKLPLDVLHTAYTIRNKYYSPGETLVQSRYNSKFVLHQCGICGEPAKDTHHIYFQSEGDAQGLIGEQRMDRNNAANLVGLCKTHHDLVHNTSLAEELIIFGYHPGGDLHYEIRKRMTTLNGRTIFPTL
jgi:DNA mismatch repair protein MutS